MKNITLILLLSLLFGCSKNDFKNQTLSFSHIDENGGKTFLDLNIDSLGNVTGSKGYEHGERITGYQDITGNLDGDKIVGSAYDENKDSNVKLKINLSKEYAEYFEEGKDMIKLSTLEKTSDESYDNDVPDEKSSNLLTCENEDVLRHLTQMMRENGVRGAKVIKGYTIRRDPQTFNCDCEARLEGEYWIKDGPAPLDRHSVKEPKIRFTLYKNYEGETMVEITQSEI